MTTNSNLPRILEYMYKTASTRQKRRVFYPENIKKNKLSK